jgi:proline iminopeptidase
VEPNVRLHYRILGEGERTLLVPNGSQLRELEPVARRHRVVFYDPRNRGRSDVAPLDRVSTEQDVRDMEEVRRQLGLERVSLLGASYYGALVALYAFEHPDRVGRVLMVSPLPVRSADFPTSESAEDPGLVELRRQGVDRSDPARYCRQYYLSEADSLLHDPASAHLMDLGFCELKNEQPAVFEAWATQIFTSLGSWDWSSRAAGLDVPVLLIQGSSDRIVPPASARRWVGLLPQGRLLPMERAGHLPWVERPDDFFAAVHAFLQGDWPPGAEKVVLPPGES